MVPALLDNAKGYWDRNNIPVVGLSDPEREVMTKYGQEFLLPKLGWMPAMVALDMHHKVSYVHYGANQRDIATSEEVMRVMRELRSYM